jgi:thioesterase domain-containing protein/aryl carrier-like protein
VFALNGSAGTAALQPGFSGPDDVALVLHTSGTTSRPKIVPLTHGNLCVSAGNIRRTLALTASDRCLNVMPLFHIHGLIGAVLSSLSAGAGVVCTPGFYAPRFFEWLDQFEPTWYSAVPTMHQAILARAAAGREIMERRPLRFIRSSSSALPPTLMSDLEDSFGAPVIESYGMTEAAHQMASNPLPPAARKPGSVGLPAGPDIAIMNDAGALLGPGATGEIVIRGGNVTPGYEGNPEANQRSFTNGWFRTGDQGRFDDDGYLFLTGRIKEIINRGGEKISPREIDEVILAHPAVAQAVTFAVPHTRLGEEIGVAVVARDGGALAESDVREFAASRLASFKIPRVVRILTEIPKGATGKIQRIGLAERLGIPPIDESAGSPAEFVEPRTPVEKSLALIWSEVLETVPIGVHDNFFQLGGDSMLATQMMARSWREIGAGVSFAAFLEAPSIAAMAARLEAIPSGAGGLVAPIRTGAGRLPLWFVPGHEGNLIAGFKLGRGLEHDQPVLGLVPPPVDGQEAWTIEWLAERYLSAIRDRQPDGPYLLAGHCFGGYVAYEMACRLRKSGQKVGMLALLDSFFLWSKSPGRGRLAARLGFVAREMKARRGHGLGAFLAGHARGFLAWRWHRLRQLEYDLRLALRLPLRKALRTPAFANDHAGKYYRPQPYSGAATIVRARDRSPFLGWDALIRGPIEVHDVPHHPRGLLDDATAEAVSRMVSNALRRAREE